MKSMLRKIPTLRFSRIADVGRLVVKVEVLIIKEDNIFTICRFVDLNGCNQGYLQIQWRCSREIQPRTGVRDIKFFSFLI